MNMTQTKRPLRAAALLLSLLLLLSAAGCGSQQSPAATEAPAPAPTEAPAPAQTETSAAPQDAEETAAPTDADRALFAELVEANSFAEVLKRHSSKQTEAVYYYEDEEVHGFTDYVNAKQFAEETSAGNGQIVMDMFHLVAGANENGPWLGVGVTVMLDADGKPIVTPVAAPED